MKSFFFILYDSSHTIIVHGAIIKIIKLQYHISVTLVAPFPTDFAVVVLETSG